VLDALVVGAGVTGLYQLDRLLAAGFDALLLEAGSGVGGTWFWNRYPGARFDSESYSYQYFHSPELLEEWRWSEEYAGQPETERYLNLAADRLGLRPHIALDSRVEAATYVAVDGQGGEPHWLVTTTAGQLHPARYLITAVGILSAPSFPAVPGLETFGGEWFHTGLWPDREVSFAGKRVAVIGTGSSGVQIVPYIARDAAHLTVFQRTPNWCTPINNEPISPEKTDWIRASTEAIHAACMASPGGFIHRPLTTGGLEVTEAEREAHWQSLYDRPGLSILLNNYKDISTNKDVNAALTAFIRDQIRARVDDPAVAEKLIPTDHTFGMKRPPLEDHYYEVFNSEHVTLVSLGEDPIERFEPAGIRTASGLVEVDLIVLATGFDAVTGSLLRMGIRGADDVSLADHWVDGPRTHLGLATAGFPNLFFVGGPQSTTGNIPRSTESQVDDVTALLVRMRDRSQRVVVTTSEAEDAWLDHVESTVRGTVLEHAESWAFGSNVAGKRHRYLLYAGGIPRYRQECDAAFADSERGFEFS
jgi:cation diffusion facilitator CzcD-associated flavoprotein CzcO